MLRVFRNDSRSPEQIFTYKGFQAWKRLDRAQAIDILRAFGGHAGPFLWPHQCIGRTLDNLRTPPHPLNPIDLMRLIKAQKTRDAFWISASPTPACGGYTSGFTYCIDIDVQNQVYHGFEGLTPGHKPLNPSIWSGNAHIAVDCMGNAGREISILTSIPVQCIQWFKPPNLNTYVNPGYTPHQNVPGWFAMPDRPLVPSRRGRRTVVPPPIPSRQGRVVPNL